MKNTGTILRTVTVRNGGSFTVQDHDINTAQLTPFARNLVAALQEAHPGLLVTTRSPRNPELHCEYKLVEA